MERTRLILQVYEKTKIIDFKKKCENYPTLVISIGKQEGKLLPRYVHMQIKRQIILFIISKYLKLILFLSYQVMLETLTFIKR